MKILSITRDGREVVNSPMNSPMLLVGRSPTCDIVLRAKGVQPVHFLIEWVGTGEFGADQEGDWTIFDISRGLKVAEKHYKTLSSGEGFVIGEKPVRVGDYDFCLRTDRLMATTLEGGTLREGFQARKLMRYSPSAAYQLEVVSIRRESGFLTHVLHLNEIKGEDRRAVIPHIPPVSVEWAVDGKGVLLQIDTKRENDIVVFPGKEALLAGQSETTSRAKLVPNDLVQIRWQMFDHYFRLVPKIEVPPVPRALFKDPFYRWALAVVIVMGLLFFFVRNMNLLPPPTIPEPPRIAKVEVKNVEIQNVPPPEPTPPPAPAKAEIDKPSVDVPKAAPNKASAPAKFASEHSQNAAGLNSPAPKANVNSLGLLGALKPQKAAVTADKVLNDGIVSKTVSRADGQFTVQQPPAGSLTKNAAASPGLSAAYTTMDKEDSQDGVSVAAIADGSGVDPTKSYTSGGTETSNEFHTEGGLDKEAVRKALLAYRKDFRTCYEQALLLKPKITGRIVYKWEISPQGLVRWVVLMSSTVGSPGLANCVQGVIKTVPFPKAPNHQPTDVIYPFVFQTKT